MTERTDRPVRRWLRRGALFAALVLVLGVLAVALGVFWLRGRVYDALPHMDGRLALAGLDAPVVVTRDGLGIPTIRGANRLDVARATGFLHGQERFFQMDLLRRRAAGELAELVGERMLAEDLSHRLHRLRARAERRWQRAPTEERALLQAYAEGVNAGLAALGSVPFEYLVLRVEPRDWSPVDSYLVVLTMFLELHDEEGRGESAVGLMRDLYPRPYFDFLAVQGTPWDAPVQGDPWPVPPIPGPQVHDPRGDALAAEGPQPVSKEAMLGDDGLPLAPASNAWVVAGIHTASGRSMLAADLHLHLSVPNIWYRAVFAWNGPGGEPHRVVGATLPGAPLMVLGSNGHVAWGLTDSQVDTNDLILLDTDPGDPDRYRTPEGYETVERFSETVRVAGGGEESLDLAWTRWGPVLGKDHLGRWRAFRWVVYEDGALDFGFRRLETARGVDEALDAAQRSGLPALNILVGDREGRIGWTLAGRLPRRIGFSGRVPTSWSNGEHRWDGLLSPDEIPELVDPASGRLWSANQRMVGGEMLAKLGDDGYALGARARQIRDRLLALDGVTEAEMLAIQLDDRALLMEPWREVFLEALTPEALEGHPLRTEARRLIEDDWNGRASVDSVGYRLVAGAHLFLVREVFSFLTSAAEQADPEFLYYGEVAQHEGPLWKLVEERPLHLLAPRYASWDEQLLASLDTAVDYLIQQSGELSEATWGVRNTAAIFHPLALPGLRGFLGMPPDPLPGDVYMPRLQTPNYGSSQRMVVAPGREDLGLFHMPAGQSGNPLSPHFRDGHDAWVRGEPTPLVPGEPIHVLTLESSI